MNWTTSWHPSFVSTHSFSHYIPNPFSIMATGRPQATLLVDYPTFVTTSAEQLDKMLEQMRQVNNSSHATANLIPRLASGASTSTTLQMKVSYRGCQDMA